MLCARRGTLANIPEPCVTNRPIVPKDRGRGSHPAAAADRNPPTSRPAASPRRRARRLRRLAHHLRAARRRPDDRREAPGVVTRHAHRHLRAAGLVQRFGQLFAQCAWRGRESSSIGTTASRSPRKLTVRAPAWPNLIRARCSASRFSSGSGTGPKRSSSSARSCSDVGDLEGAGDAPVDVDLRLLVGDVVGRDVRIDVDVESHRLRALPPAGAIVAGFALGFGDRPRRASACTGSKAERRDVAGLLVAEQVARAPDLEIAHRDLEAGAESRCSPTAPTAAAPPPR